YTQGERFQNVRPQPRAPIAHRVRKEFLVNDDLEVLDAMYLKLFGKDLGLSEDVKWQAVTHKTFDHGRQPFNSKLKFLGKRLLQTQISIHLLSVPLKGGPKEPKPSVYKSLEGSLYQNPEPFVHEDYKSLENITGARIEGLMSESRLMPLIEEVGLPNVMRWKPAEISDLKRSGQQPVALECLFAITGAVALQKGGDVAVQFIRDRILT
ncbi:ribonuclease-III-like-domain-containing protein, partial [Tricharina praecox]|uniref:ribonuclease-III-like-domain-containing protein n=1 Tax=Tricharina praecox TaxID=43433 RepID=UPI00221FAB49